MRALKPHKQNGFAGLSPLFLFMLLGLFRSLPAALYMSLETLSAGPCEND